ncbi:MAG: GTP-binding protein [Candidatus Heimdallarchaeota archaeon]|nr:GTP-binding protein [Candidatus Heimdallarchaeota archaeon]
MPNITRQRKTAKVLFLGEGAVGKSSLTRVITNEELVIGCYNYVPPKVTIGLEIQSLNFKQNGEHYDISVWDFGGQPQFRFFQKGLMSLGIIGILVFDVTRQSSLQKLAEWHQMAKDSSKVIQFIVVGNKIDKANRSITPRTAQKYAIGIDSPYLETSAVTLAGVPKLRHVLKGEIVNLDKKLEKNKNVE